MSDFQHLSDDEKSERIANMRQQAQGYRERHKNGKYMSVSDSIDEFKSADSTSKKAAAGVKIFGKSLFNVGRFAVTEVLPEFLEAAANTAEKSIKK